MAKVDMLGSGEIFTKDMNISEANKFRTTAKNSNNSSEKVLANFRNTSLNQNGLDFASSTNIVYCTRVGFTNITTRNLSEPISKTPPTFCPGFCVLPLMLVSRIPQPKTRPLQASRLPT